MRQLCVDSGIPVDSKSSILQRANGTVLCECMEVEDYIQRFVNVTKRAEGIYSKHFRAAQQQPWLYRRNADDCSG